MRHLLARRAFPAVLAALLLLGGGPALAAPEPYDISSILSLAGPVAFTGRAMAQTLHVIEAMVNASGGIQGHPLRINVLDDQSSPQIAVQLANGLVADKAPVILGPGFASTCLALQTLIAANGPVEYCFSPAIRPARGGYLFSASISGDDQAKGFLRFFRARHWNRIAFLSTTDATGQSYDRSFAYLMALPENRSLISVAHENFSAGDISISAQLERVKAAKPDVVIAACSGAPFGTVVHGAFDTGLNLPIATLFSNMTFAQMDQYKAFLPETLLFAGPRSMSPTGTNPGPVRDAQQRYFAAFKAAGVRPDAGNNLAWDGTWIIIDALRHLGVKATATQVRDYITNLHGWVGANGVYDFGDSEQRGIGINGLLIERWDPATRSFLAIARPGEGPS